MVNIVSPQLIQSIIYLHKKVDINHARVIVYTSVSLVVWNNMQRHVIETAQRKFNNEANSGFIFGVNSVVGLFFICLDKNLIIF